MNATGGVDLKCSSFNGTSCITHITCYARNDLPGLMKKAEMGAQGEFFYPRGAGHRRSDSFPPVVYTVGVNFHFH